MHEDLEKYNLEYERIINTDNNQKLLFELHINFLNSQYKDTLPVSNYGIIINRATSSAKFYIDELISHNKFKEAQKFCKDAELKLYNINVIGMDPNRRGQSQAFIENLFEIYNYRIVDREYIYNAKKKTEEIEKKSENKIYEVLTIFVTIISVIFAFVNGGQVKILYFRVPAFVVLALTIIFSWWVIKIINKKIQS